MQIYFKRNNNKTAGLNEDFFKRESEANQSRKRDISNLNYIIIPDNLPFIKNRHCRNKQCRTEYYES